MCNREFSLISVSLMKKTAQILRFHGVKYYEWDIHGYATA
jgi:hypothetical protein